MNLPNLGMNLPNLNADTESEPLCVGCQKKKIANCLHNYLIMVYLCFHQSWLPYFMMKKVS